MVRNIRDQLRYDKRNVARILMHSCTIGMSEEIESLLGERMKVIEKEYGMRARGKTEA